VLTRLRHYAVLSAASLILGVVLGTTMFRESERSAASTAPRPRAEASRADAVVRVARDRARSVVLLHSAAGAAAVPNDGREWLIEPVREGLGSGIVIDNDGLILTNAHVVGGARELHVRRPDGQDLSTALVGIDADTDLALVRVSDATGLSPAPLGDSDRAEVGSFVVVIGSPLGLHHTVTMGVLSAKARGLDNSGLEFLQTDAAVNPGSSGGPLLDLSGRVIGVITAMASEAGDNVGLNFAVPINLVKELLPALRTNSVTHAWLGIAARALNRNGAVAFGLARPSDGELVTAVDPEGPAAAAGVAPMDVLLGLAGQPPVRAIDVYRHIRRLSPGDIVRLRILRNGRELEVPVVLGSRPRR